MSRRTFVRVFMDGVDVSGVINQYLLSMSFTDYEEDKADDLQIRLQDKDGVWLFQWLKIAAGSRTSIKGMIMDVFFVRSNWSGVGDSVLLHLGQFEIDSVLANGPPSIVTLKATALPFIAPIRQQKKNKAWENYKLKKIAGEIASKNGLTLMYDADINPKYDRVEQVDTTDIVFLKNLCAKAGLSLKATAKMIVIFDQQKYEGKAPVAVITYGGGYTRYKLQTKEADTKYTSCHVCYTDPDSGKTIEYTYKDPNAKKDDVPLEVRDKVKSKAEAKTLAQKLLRFKNKFEASGSFTFPGAPFYLAGLNVKLQGFGTFDGKYMISESRHEVGKDGYTTEIRLRTVLEGY